MPFSDVIQKFHDQLIAAGVEEGVAAYSSGQFSSQVVGEVMQHVQDTLGEEQLTGLEDMETEEQIKEIENLYQQKTGQTVAEYRDQLAEKKLAEFKEA